MNRNNLSARHNRDRDYGIYNDGMYRGEALYDGTSIAGPGTPNFKTRAPTSSVLGVGDANAPDPALVTDMLLDLLVAKVKAIADNMTRMVIAAVAAIIYAVSIVMAIVKIFPSAKMPGMIVNTSAWRWLQKSPLVLWFILASISASLLPVLSATIPNLNVYANLVIGSLMLIYVIKTWSSCSRYLLAIAAVYIIVVALMQLKLLGVSTVTSQGVLWNLIYWNALIVYVLSLVDHFIVWPQCKY